MPTPKADPVTPRLFTPEPLLHPERLCSGSHVINGYASASASASATPHDYETAPEVSFVETPEAMYLEEEVQGIQQNPEDEPENGINEMVDDDEDEEKDKENENEAEEDHNWVDSGSEFVLNSQQLVEALSLCDDLLQVSQDREGNVSNGGSRNKQPCFADYAHLGTEDFKRDLEDCQRLVLDPSNIDLDTPPDFRLSQLEFGSEDSFLAWGTGKTDN
ncbi:unnamed protein product [Microthlaspi erraticum]|nr:unnamed protein product [Microthlaspi erraticum]